MRSGWRSCYKASDSVVLLLWRAARVFTHSREPDAVNHTRLWSVYVCLRSHKRWGVCVCWGGCLGFHSLAAPYTVRTHQRWREREGGRDGWGGRRRRKDRTRRWRGCTDSFTRALLGRLRPLTQADRYWTIETRGSYSPLFFSAIVLSISNPH